MKITEIKITSSTLTLSFITLLMPFVTVFYPMYLTHIANYGPSDMKQWMIESLPHLKTTILFGTSILPIYWAWQNSKEYNKSWFYAPAIVLVILRIPLFVALAVIIIYCIKIASKQKQKIKDAV